LIIVDNAYDLIPKPMIAHGIEIASRSSNSKEYQDKAIGFNTITEPNSPKV
jgi:hypothetical protein